MMMITMLMIVIIIKPQYVDRVDQVFVHRVFVAELRDDTDREGVCSSKVLVLVECNKISQGMLLCIERSSGVEVSGIVGLAGGVHCCCDESAKESGDGKISLSFG
uniref:Uncharacterized protein n=1 Tax=Glossina pallidipes TaxID=7398 RepID=A0A1A9ZJF9_GLOPL